MLVELGADDATPVPNRFGYPMATVQRWDGRSCGSGSARMVRAWWRIAVALEICGAARAALDTTVAHVRGRHQFGRPLGSFQAVQHRLAECEVLIEGARWLALEAAWSWADPERAAAAAVQALRAGERTFWETHQLSGALGFAVEYDLHLWTMRLPALRSELLSIGQPAAALTSARWSLDGAMTRRRTSTCSYDAEQDALASSVRGVVARWQTGVGDDDRRGIRTDCGRDWPSSACSGWPRRRAAAERRRSPP